METIYTDAAEFAPGDRIVSSNGLGRRAREIATIAIHPTGTVLVRFTDDPELRTFHPRNGEPIRFERAADRAV